MSAILSCVAEWQLPSRRQARGAARRPLGCDCGIPGQSQNCSEVVLALIGLVATVRHPPRRPEGRVELLQAVRPRANSEKPRLHRTVDGVAPHWGLPEKA